jgi:hypothetical protein
MIEAREADHREKLGKPQRSSREQVTGLRFLILIAPYLRERDGPVRLQQTDAGRSNKVNSKWKDGGRRKDEESPDTEK